MLELRSVAAEPTLRIIGTAVDAAALPAAGGCTCGSTGEREVVLVLFMELPLIVLLVLLLVLLLSGCRRAEETVAADGCRTGAKNSASTEMG